MLSRDLETEQMHAACQAQQLTSEPADIAGSAGCLPGWIWSRNLYTATTKHHVSSGFVIRVSWTSGCGFSATKLRSPCELSHGVNWHLVHRTIRKTNFAETLSFRSCGCGNANHCPVQVVNPLQSTSDGRHSFIYRNCHRIGCSVLVASQELE